MFISELTEITTLPNLWTRSPQSIRYEGSTLKIDLPQLRRTTGLQGATVHECIGNIIAAINSGSTNIEVSLGEEIPQPKLSILFSAKKLAREQQELDVFELTKSETKQLIFDRTGYEATIGVQKKRLNPNKPFSILVQIQIDNSRTPDLFSTPVEV